MLQLPTETLTAIVAFLNPASIKCLRASCSALRVFIGTLPASFWREKIRSCLTQTIGTYSEPVTCTPESVLSFGGSKLQGFAAVPHIPLTNISLDTSTRLTISVWIKCHPATVDVAEKLDGPYQGGIVLGCQSLPYNSTAWPHYHWHIISIDMAGKVHASFDSTAHRAIIGDRVNDGNWHHIVLASNVDSQTLYIDSVKQGTLNSFTLSRCFNSRHHAYLQLGSGYISGASKGRPANVWNGRYPFHGEISNFRLIRRTCSEKDVLRLHQLEDTANSDGLGFLESVPLSTTESTDSEHASLAIIKKNDVCWALRLLELCASKAEGGYRM
ncbi:hypothetical protein BDR26DRAFT_855235 [Obelidium mucronatum]|nr:hypothetical protein BDR26DRAFT_855235 [Obelidium mucronatum]